MNWTITLDGHNIYDDQRSGEVFHYILIDALEDWIPYIYCPSDTMHFMSKNWYRIHKADGSVVTAEEIRLSKGLEPSAKS